MSDTLGSDARRTLRGSIANYVAALFQLAVFLFHILATRIFGKTAYGAYIFAWSIVEMGCKVGIVGMDKGMLREVAVARARGDPEAEVRTIASGLKTVFVVSLGVVGTLWILAAHQDEPEYRNTLLALAPLVLSWSIALTLVSATMATGTMRYNLAVRGVAEPTLMIAMLIISGALFGSAGGAGVALSHLSASLLTVLLATWALTRRFDGRAVLRGIASRSWESSLLRFCAPIMPAELLNQAIYRLDIVFLGVFLGEPAAVAEYGACVLLAGTVSSVRYAFDPILSPLAAECATRNDIQRLASNLARMTRWVLALSTPIFIAFVVFGDLLLGLWGPAYPEARGPLVVLACAHLVNAVLGLHQWPVVMSGRSRLDLVNNVAGFAVIVGLNLLLIPRYGLLGAAVATLSGNLAFRVLQVVEVRSIFRVNAFGRRLGRTALAGLVSLAIQVGIRAGAPHPGWGTFALSTLAGLAVSLGLTLVGGRDPEDRALWATLTRRRSTQD